MTDPITRHIPASSLPALRKQLDKWTRYAERHGIPPVRVDIVEDDRIEFIVERLLGLTNQNWTSVGILPSLSDAEYAVAKERIAFPLAAMRIRQRSWHLVSIAAETLQTEDGCVLVGMICRSATGNPIPMSIGTTQIPTAILAKCGTCDHCKTVRKRRDTFVLIDRNGFFRCVGRSCLRPCLGIDPERVISAVGVASLPDEMRDPDPSKDHVVRETFWSVDAVIRASLVVMDQNGGAYVRSDHHTGGTRAAVRMILSESDLDDLPALLRRRMEDPSVKEEASRVVDWCRSLPVGETVSLVDTMREIALDGSCPQRMLGIACYIAAAYRKEQGFVGGGDRLPRATTEILGQEGDELDLLIHVTAMRGVESSWGQSTLILGRTDRGHLLSWFTTSRKLLEACRSSQETGEPIAVRARLGRVTPPREGAEGADAFPRHGLRSVRVH